MTSSLSGPYSEPPLAAKATNPVSFKSEKPPLLAKVFAEHTIQRKDFTAREWKRYYNAEVQSFDLGPEFEEWWLQPDAVDPSKRNCDTHFSPILCPETLLETADLLPPPALRHRFTPSADCTPYSLDALERLVQNPKEGHSSEFAHSQDAPALQQNRMTPAGPACFIVARKELFARNLPLSEQKEYIMQINNQTNANYQVLPRALHLATVALVHHTVTGNRFLGDATGMEKCWSYGRCEEVVRWPSDICSPVIVGGHEPFVREVVGDPAPPRGLHVAPDDIFQECTGVIGVKKFPAHRKAST